MQVDEDTITSLLEKDEEQTPPPKRLKLSVPTGAKLAKMVSKPNCTICKCARC